MVTSDDAIEFFGTDGDDTLRGNARNNVLYGYIGMDEIFGEDGRDLLVGGADDDTLSGGLLGDTLLGGDGDDVLLGEAGNDLLEGGADNDILDGGNDRDTLIGGTGADRLIGGAGNDDLSGEDGNDTLFGDDGNDTLQGNAGNDMIIGGTGADEILGGWGDDEIDGGADNDLIYGDDGADTVYGSEGKDTIYGADGDDSLVGGARSDELYGGDGDDTLAGHDGGDLLVGNGGRDLLLGGDNPDELRGGDGADTLRGDGGPDLLYGQNGDDFLAGGDGHDLLHGGPGNDEGRGGNGNDSLFGHSGNDILSGHAGRDFITGGDGDDTLRGGTERDELRGGAGRDVLYGGAGVNDLYGNGGADTFVLGAGSDIIYDFDTDQGDRIDLGKLLPGFDPALDEISDFVRVTFNYGRGDSIVEIDADGSAGPASFREAATLKASNFVNLEQLIGEGGLSLDGSLVPPKTYEITDTSRLAAAEFLDFLAINVHIDANFYEDTTVSLIDSAMDFIGFDHIRTGAPVRQNLDPGNSYEQLADMGYDFTFTVRNFFPQFGQELMDQYLAYFDSFEIRNPGSVRAIEGLNEVGNLDFDFEGGSGKTAAAAYQQFLYDAIKSDPNLQDTSVINLSVFFGRDAENYEGFGDLSASSDFTNSHIYTNTRLVPFYDIMNRLENAELIDSDSPAMITEIGYPTVMIKGHPIAVNETVQAKLTLNALMDSYLQGVEEVFLYELFDRTTGDPRAPQNNFGLFTSDGTAKEAAVALQALTTILSDGVDPDFEPTAGTDYELTGGDANTRSFAIQEAADETDIIIWREDVIWDRASLEEIEAETLTVTLDLGAVYSSVAIYDPMQGSAPIETFENADSVSVDVSDHPLVVELGAVYTV
ncbi:hypothetical protein OCH239_01245 [Roseivivax halodurans JCM 10272]|uniref:Calcium-binding protein n=1 Tax=Roseivivax halodurans JCM 10272 TaxID=1449350 RepID=X7EMU0_9RHOB|nr:calcium-binding protein [Roseivivax halodurans]ETX16491.1 hypothetical protein OCH239_01245 [Roseivivax halodurans JCM 10272]